MPTQQNLSKSTLFGATWFSTNSSLTSVMHRQRRPPSPSHKTASFPAATQYRSAPHADVGRLGNHRDLASARSAAQSPYAVHALDSRSPAVAPERATQTRENGMAKYSLLAPTSSQNHNLLYPGHSAADPGVSGPPAAGLQLPTSSGVSMSHEPQTKKRKLDTVPQSSKGGEVQRSSRHIHLLEVIEFLRLHRPDDYPRFVADCSALYSEKYSRSKHRQFASDMSRDGMQRIGTPMRASTPSRPHTPSLSGTPFAPSTPSRPPTPSMSSPWMNPAALNRSQTQTIPTAFQSLQPSVPFITPQAAMEAASAGERESSNHLLHRRNLVETSTSAVQVNSQSAAAVSAQAATNMKSGNGGLALKRMRICHGLRGHIFDPVSYRTSNRDASHALVERYMHWEQSRSRSPDDAVQGNIAADLQSAMSFLELAFSSNPTRCRAGCLLTDSFGPQKIETIFSFAEKYVRSYQLSNEDKTPRVLIVVPDLSLDDWREKCSLIPTSIAVMLLSADLADGDTDIRLSVYVNYLRNWAGIMIIQLSTYAALVTCDKVELDNRERSNRAVIKNALIQPGADVVVLDEGHRLRKMNQSAARALRRVETWRRITLTAAPLASNLFEYWAMVDWVAPGLLGSADEFSEVCVRRIADGHRDSCSAEQREEARRCAWNLCNRVKPLAVSAPGDYATPPSWMHLAIYTHMDPVQAECYVRVAEMLRKCVAEDRINRVIAARILQVAASHTFALEKLLLSPQDIRVPDRDDRSSMLREIKRASSVLKRIAESVQDILFQTESSRMQHPSAKLLVLDKIFQVCQRRGERVVVFTESREVQRALYAGLRSSLEGRGDCADYVFLCDTNQTKQDRDMELKKWDSAPEGAAMLTVIGPLSEDVELAGWKFLGVSRIVVVDCSWSTAYMPQIFSRVRSTCLTQPLFIYSLISAATCERIWDARHLSVLSADDAAFVSERIDFLVDREISTMSFQPPSPKSWDFAVKPLNPPTALPKRGITDSVIDLDESCGNVIAELLAVRMDGSKYAVFEIHAPKSSKLFLAPQVLFEGLRGLKQSDRVVANQEYLEAEAAYAACSGLEVWEELEGRLTRGAQVPSAAGGVQEMMERHNCVIPSSSDLHDFGCTWTLYLSMIPQWDLFSRKFMKTRSSSKTAVGTTENVNSSRMASRKPDAKSSGASSRTKGFAKERTPHWHGRSPNGFEVKRRGRTGHATLNGRGDSYSSSDRASLSPKLPTRPSPGAGRGIGLTVPAWARNKK